MEAFLSIFAFFILLLLDNSRAQSAGFWVTFFVFLLSVFRFYSSLRREYCSWLSEFHALGLLKVLFFFFLEASLNQVDSQGFARVVIWQAGKSVWLLVVPSTGGSREPLSAIFPRCHSGPSIDMLVQIGHF